MGKTIDNREWIIENLGSGQGPQTLFNEQEV
jgi:hypothetical protein